MGTYSEDIFGLDFAPAGLHTLDPTHSFNLPTLFAPDEDDDLDLPFTRTNHAPATPWPTKLPLELALNIEPVDVTLARHSVTEEDYLKWALSPAFRRALAEAAKDVREQGLTFRILCQSIAQDFLGELDDRLHDKTVAFSVKLDAFKTVTRLAGLDPKDDKSEKNQSQNLVNIQINL